jgi:hypothetical protein
MMLTPGKEYVLFWTEQNRHEAMRYSHADVTQATIRLYFEQKTVSMCVEQQELWEDKVKITKLP